jgi:glycosyltransferase involved in cell wall biosynthesis
MKLLVDARCFQDPAYSARGIGRHAAGVLRHAWKFLPSPLEIVGLLDPALGDLSREQMSLFDTIQYHVTPPHPSEGQALFFQPSPMTHPANRIGPILCREHILSCEIFYDLVPLDDPMFYLDGIGARQAYLGNLAWLKQYRLHAPISRHALQCLVEMAGVPDSSIAVTGACLRQVFSDFDPARASALPRLCRFATGTYFIMVGGEDPRKNTTNVLAAQAKLARQGLRTRLLIVGLYAECVMKALLERHKELGGNNGDIQFLHGISDEELTALYFHAKACICPSRNEGFSLPIVEAMSCGVPVLAAGSSAQSELVEQPNALFDPENIDAIAAAIKRIESEPTFRDELLHRQACVAPRYAEGDVAARLWMLVRSHLVNSAEFRISSRPVKPRLAFLAPYPPRGEMQIGYLPAVLRSLSELADISVFTDENQPRPDPWIKAFEPLSSMAHLSSEYDRVVTVLGLTPEMRRFRWVAERIGGAGLLYTRQGSTRWADPLLVHSRLVMREIDHLTPGSVEFLPPCFTHVLADRELTVESRRHAREQLGFATDRVHILVVDLWPDENAMRLFLHGFEQLRAWGIDAELHFAGASGKACRGLIGKLAEHLDVSESVRVPSGLVDEAAWKAHLQAADLGVCLGDSNAVDIPSRLFEMIGAGIPTVTNRDMAQG